MRLWLIPTIYVLASVAGGLAVPRMERAYLPLTVLDMSVSSAQAYLSAVASGMMGLTAIVFAMAFIMVQFSAIAYSPRLMLLWFARDRLLFHSLGIFIATFTYALFTLGWVDRGGTATVPAISPLIVAVMLIVSMLLFARLVQRLGELQITSVLHLIGERGRGVIREMFKPVEQAATAREVIGPVDNQSAPGATMQYVNYSGSPRTIAKFDIDALVRQAAGVGGVIVMTSAVGDTLVQGTPVLQVLSGARRLPEESLMRAIHLEAQRTFEQDPKYSIRLLVDIAIKALSPAINDPTTAVQTIDQIEDLLLRLGACELDAGYARDASGTLRLIFPMATWEDYMSLAFDEIRQYGASSVQVMRRLRSAMVQLANSLSPARAEVVRKHLAHLDAVIEHSPLDAEDRLIASQEDRQGLGQSRQRATFSR
jgi:uncharacterized membrane protein